jgi:hypothetical protein
VAAGKRAWGRGVLEGLGTRRGDQDISENGRNKPSSVVVERLRNNGEESRHRFVVGASAGRLRPSSTCGVRLVVWSARHFGNRTAQCRCCRTRRAYGGVAEDIHPSWQEWPWHGGRPHCPNTEYLVRHLWLFLPAVTLHRNCPVTVMMPLLSVAVPHFCAFLAIIRVLADPATRRRT